jgi:peroxiredoxin Q/BCP
MKRHPSSALALAALILAASCASTALAEPLAVGAEAPKAEVKDQDGKAVNLETLYKKGLTLVFFYPKASTSGCTIEVCGMRDTYDALTKQGVSIVGVSMDNEADQKKFHSEHKLQFPLLADTEGKIVKGFGVPELKPGIPSRQSFLIKDGKVVWRDTQVSPKAHADSIKKAVSDAGATEAGKPAATESGAKTPPAKKE